MHILVVEDDPELGFMLERMLVGSGHTVARVMRGGDAITASLQADFDLLMCDLMLPDLQGTDVIRALKAQAPHLPVMVVSALDPNVWRDKCIDAGATGFIQKPIKLKLLREEIAMVEASRASLRVGLLDLDPVHRARIHRELSLHGCAVELWHERTAPADLSALPEMVMVDAHAPDVEAVIAHAAAAHVPVFVISEGVSGEDEERFMRAGAALCLKKPLDPEAVLVQARFLINH